MTDVELRRLLVEELTKHLPALTSRDMEAARRAVHALKGSAGLAGEAELANALLRLERRLKDADADAVMEAEALVRRARARLSGTGVEPVTEWPEPPLDLETRTLDHSLLPQYIAEVLDRLAKIDEGLSGSMSPVEALAFTYRQIHSIKGAASAVGDEPMAWFCHGLEDRLKLGVTGQVTAQHALSDIARWRVVLSAFLDDPDSALRSLRGAAPRRFPPSQAPSMRPDDERSTSGSEETIRVSALAVDRLIERTAAMSVAREGIASQASLLHDHASRMTQFRTRLSEALRLIGPARPWGAPAAALKRIEDAATGLVDLAEESETMAESFALSSRGLRDAMGLSRRDLSAMRQTTLRSMFDRLAHAVEAEARRAGRDVVVHTQGDVAVDRRIIEQLYDPCLQLARNAVAHGIEPVDVRTAENKPAAGTITITSKRRAGTLSVTIADDGAGVDVGAVRARAVESNLITQELADAADDDTILALLFLPGFSMQKTSDFLAGRGIGLDIVLSAVQRLGGATRLSSRRGEGFVARIDVPTHGGVTNVLWVEAAGVSYAVNAAHVAAVRKNEDESVPHLTECLGGARAVSPLALDLHIEGDEPVALGIDSVGEMDALLVRPLPPFVARMGPYGGAIVGGDGVVRFVVDVFALAPIARALGLVPGAVSERPVAAKETTF